MKSLRHRVVLAAGVLSVLAALPHLVLSQNLNPAELLHPSADSWPGYHGDYSGRRHSHLTQITPQNVGKLSLAWAFQTDQTAQIKSSPLLVDGVLYFTVPENIWAVDARSGHQLWHYTYPPSPGDHIGNRGVGMYKGCLPGPVSDARKIPSPPKIMFLIPGTVVI